MVKHNREGANYVESQMEQSTRKFHVRRGTLLILSPKANVASMYRATCAEQEGDSLVVNFLTSTAKDVNELFVVRNFNLPRIECTSETRTFGGAEHDLEYLRLNKLHEHVRVDTRYRPSQEPLKFYLAFTMQIDKLLDLQFLSPPRENDHVMEELTPC